jgi:putative intracellular protease/amidase
MGRRRISGKPGDAQTGNGGYERVAAKPEELVSLAGMTFGAVIVSCSTESRDTGCRLVPASPARGRTLTSYHTLQDDLRNAGATWADREVVVHGNPVTGRPPSDIPAVTREMLNLFASARGA